VRTSTGATTTTFVGPAIVSGWYGFGNSGDEALLSVIVAQLAGMGIDRVDVLTAAPDAVTRRLGARGVTGVADCDSYGVGGLKNLLNGSLIAKVRHLRRARVFILGGGSLLRDNTSRHNQFRLIDDVVISRLCGVPVFLCALGVGPIETRLGRFLIGLACRCATLVTVRDERSAALVRGLGIPAGKVKVVSDPAFLLDDVPVAAALTKAGLDDVVAGGEPSLFVYPTVSMTMPPLAEHDDRHLRSLAAALDEICDAHGFRVCFIPFWVTGSDRDDVAISRRVVALMRHQSWARVVTAQLDPEELRALTTVPTVNLTVRLHAMIYAASKGVPCVPIDYEPKVAANAERFGLSELVVGFSETMAADIVDAVHRFLARRSTLEADLATRLPRLRDEAAETFRLLGRIIAPAERG
jgi:polysaccharide pyruvyl transferase CsaB